VFAADAHHGIITCSSRQRRPTLGANVMCPVLSLFEYRCGGALADQNAAWWKFQDVQITCMTPQTADL
jgi:hypothetical protein